MFHRRAWVGCTIVPLGSIREFGKRLATNSKRIFVFALILAAFFLAAQLHRYYCVDLNSGTFDSHPCPVCHVVGAAIAACALVFALGGSVHRLEILTYLPPRVSGNFPKYNPQSSPDRLLTP